MQVKCGSCGTAEELIHVCSACKARNKLLSIKEKRDLLVEHHSKCTCGEGFDKDKEYSLKEWLNFDYKEYLAQILLSVSKDKFKQLAATSQVEIKAGLLTTIEIDKLKGVMDDAFNKEWSINRIAEEIDKEISLKDRFVIKDGQIVLTKDNKPRLALTADKRSIAIARTESVRLSNLGAVNHFRNEGAVAVTWVANFDARTCAICDELNGQIFTIEESIQMEEAGRFPGSIHMNCRCTWVALGGK